MDSIRRLSNYSYVIFTLTLLLFPSFFIDNPPTVRALESEFIEKNEVILKQIPGRFIVTKSNNHLFAYVLNEHESVRHTLTHDSTIRSVNNPNVFSSPDSSYLAVEVEFFNGKDTYSHTPSGKEQGSYQHYVHEFTAKGKLIKSKDLTPIQGSYFSVSGDIDNEFYLFNNGNLLLVHPVDGTIHTFAENRLVKKEVSQINEPDYAYEPPVGAEVNWLSTNSLILMRSSHYKPKRSELIILESNGEIRKSRIDPYRREDILINKTRGLIIVTKYTSDKNDKSKSFTIQVLNRDLELIKEKKIGEYRARNFRFKENEIIYEIPDPTRNFSSFTEFEFVKRKLKLTK